MMGCTREFVDTRIGDWSTSPAISVARSPCGMNVFSPGTMLAVTASGVIPNDCMPKSKPDLSAGKANKSHAGEEYLERSIALIA